MAVFRTEKTEDFTTMSNYHFKDRRLSMKAKGLLSMMLSFADDWQYSLNGLAAMNREGLTAIRATVQELEDNDYLVRRRFAKRTGAVVGRRVRYLRATAIIKTDNEFFCIGKSDVG